MVYDFIILGGGIAGLYTAYQLLEKNVTGYKILLLEKEVVLGGRIHTYHDKYMNVEAGGSRFHSGQPRIMKLIRDLGLGSKIVDISTDFSYIPSPTTAAAAAGTDDVISKRNTLLRHLSSASKKVAVETMRNMSLLDFAKTVLDNTDVELICDSFGYYTEIVSMNAHDALYLITEHLSGKHQFHVLAGGLSQLTDALEQKIKKGGNVTILKNHTVVGIRCYVWNSIDDTSKTPTVDKFEVSCADIERKYYGKTIIAALPKQVLEKIPIFAPLRPLLDKIVCGPLCRIYSKFPLDKSSGKPWFHGISKFTTNNKLRMVIPIDESAGVIMSSYTDNVFAKYWKKLYDRDRRNAGRTSVVGTDSVDDKLVQLLHETTGRDVPMPLKTNVFYWGCGVGYWGVGADSSDISKTILQPFPHNIFICGEHFSEKNQQWIEGALETSFNAVGICCDRKSL